MCLFGGVKVIVFVNVIVKKYSPLRIAYLKAGNARGLNIQISCIVVFRGVGKEKTPLCSMRGGVAFGGVG